MRIYTSICMHQDIHTYVYILTRIYTGICMNQHIWVCAYMYVCVYTYMYWHMCEYGIAEHIYINISPDARRINKACSCVQIMCRCVHVCVLLCTHTCRCIAPPSLYTHMYTDMCMCKHTSGSEYTCKYMVSEPLQSVYTCMCIDSRRVETVNIHQYHTHICVYKHTCVYVYTLIDICMYQYSIL